MASEVRHGDCLEVVRGLAAESVNLVYIDPPFFTQKTHSLVTRDRSTKFEFSDAWKSRAEYIEFLRVRVKEFRRVLKATGSLFFHCDTNASHHIRCLLDEICGELMFRSEIIWHYRRWSNSQRNPMPSHQWKSTVLWELCGVSGPVDVGAHCYKPRDRLLDRQKAIQKALAAKHLREDSKPCGDRG